MEERGEVQIETDDQTHVLKPEHFITTTSLPQKYDAVEFSQGVIYVNKEMSEEMHNEGMAREVMRTVQQSRKEVGLTKSVSVDIWVVTDEETASKVKPFFSDEVMEKIKASSFSISDTKPEGIEPAYSQKVKDANVEVFIKK